MGKGLAGWSNSLRLLLVRLLLALMLVRLHLLLAELVLSTGGPCQISQDVADCCRGWGRYCLTPNQMRCPALWEGLQDRIDLLEKLRGVWLVGMLLRSCLRIPSARMVWVLRSGRVGSLRGGGVGCTRLHQRRRRRLLLLLLLLLLECMLSLP